MRIIPVAMFGGLIGVLTGCEGLELKNLDASILDDLENSTTDLATDEIPGDGDVDPGDDAQDDPTDDETDEPTDETDDTDSPVQIGDILLEQLAPEHGSTTGSSAVTISGSTFSANTRVFFGNAEGTVQSWTNNALIVATPPNSAGWVDVRVEDQGSEDTLTDAYRYWQDGSGQTALFGSVSWYQSIGNYWSNDFEYGIADAYISDPVNVSEYWELFVPSLDSCSSTYDPGIGPTVTNLPTLSYTENGSPEHTMNPVQAIPGYYVGPVPVGGYDSNSMYGFSSPGNANWPAFDLANVAATTAEVTMTSPNLYGNFVPNIQQNNFVLEWSGGGGDYMLATLLRYGPATASTGVYEEVMFCAMRDDGYFQVPSSVWTGWSNNQQIDIEVGRVYAESGTLPYNNAGTALAGIYWVVGAGFQK